MLFLVFATVFETPLKSPELNAKIPVTMRPQIISSKSLSNVKTAITISVNSVLKSFVLASSSKIVI